MTWSEYLVTFSAASPEAALNGGSITRYIRATSERDARYRVVRKFILPIDAEIVSVERCT